MNTYNVINYNCNSNKFETYDVLPYLRNCYNTTKKEKPKTFDEFKQFVKDESLYQFWSRCEYEIILVDWPCKKHSEKWDVYDQIIMNLDIVTRLLMEDVL